MKKVMVLITIMLLALTGCGGNNTARKAVEDFYNQYNNLNVAVLDDLEKVIDKESFNDEEKNTYREILKKQYSDLKYEILSEEYNGSKATVKTKIEVYDLYKAQSDAAAYLNANVDEFKDESGNIDNTKFLDYKLEQMKLMTDTIEYTIEFNVTKDSNGNWNIDDVTNIDLEKIHGIYNYDTQNF